MEEAVAIIVTHEDKYVLQLRDDNTKHFPNYWGTYGGAVEPGESPWSAMLRELKEEIGWSNFPSYVDIGRVDSGNPYWLPTDHIGRDRIHYWRVDMPDTSIIQTNEGRGFGVFSWEEICGLDNVAPAVIIGIMYWRLYVKQT